MNRPTVGSLFSGVGGLDLGLERAGFKTRWFCESEADCREILARHWPGIPCYEDARILPDPPPDRVDLLAGGFPCQPVSEGRAMCGGPIGEDDPRWGWPWFRNWIDILRPSHVLLENVPGILSARTGYLGDRIRVDLDRIGYQTDKWEHMPAGGLGAVHRRDRVFLVGYSEREGLQRRGVLSDLARKAKKAAKEAPQWEWMRNPAGDHLAPVGRLAAGQERWGGEPQVRRVVDGISWWVVRHEHRMLGNAVCPPVAEAIGRELIKLFRPPPHQGDRVGGGQDRGGINGPQEIVSAAG